MLKWIRVHIGQFALYVLSGGTAAIVDFGGYLLLFNLGMWYLYASIISSVAGFFTTFLMNKYIAFRKRSDFMKHLGRFFLVDMINIAITNLLLVAFVEWFGLGEEIAKFIAMGMVVLWNFFIYKFFVYV